MKLIHTTGREAARRILESGFVDGGAELLDGKWRRGVWLSDQPLELGEVFLEIDVPDQVVEKYAVPSELHGYPRWLIPSAELNAYGPARELIRHGE